MLALFSRLMALVPPLAGAIISLDGGRGLDICLVTVLVVHVRYALGHILGERPQPEVRALLVCVCVYVYMCVCMYVYECLHLWR